MDHLVVSARVQTVFASHGLSQRGTEFDTLPAVIPPEPALKTLDEAIVYQMGCCDGLKSNLYH
jgi:hypothetical protein